MGIVMGALAGLGEAAADIGRRNQIAQLEQEKEARGYQQQTDLTKLRADLEEQKAMSLEKFKREQGLQEKQRIGGIVTGAMQSKQADIDASLDPFGANPSQGEIRRAVTNSPREALMNAGELDAAKAYAAAQEQGQFSLGYGQTRYDSEGKPIADNAAEVRAQAALQTTAAKQQMAEAAMTRANNRGKVQPLDQTELGKVNEQIGKYVKTQFAATKNPFAQPGAEDTTDAAKQVLASSVLSKAANEVGIKSGVALNVPDAMTKLLPVINKYDAAITAKANELGDANFDEKGKPIQGRIDDLKKAGFPASALGNKTAFQEYYRNKYMQDTDKFESFFNAQGQVPASTPTATSQPAAAPAKPAGIASNAAVAAPPPKEEAPAMSKTEQLRQQQAQTEKRNRAEESLKASDPDLKALRSQVQAAISKNDLGGAKKLNDQYDQLLQAKLSKI